MKSQHLKIGISGGTFDPIHHGHLIMAQEIGEKLELDRVVFIPVGHPPHKPGSSVTDAFHRFNMVREAVGSNPLFEVSGIEVERPGYTYTVDTLEELKGRYRSDSEFYFIIGADTISQLVTWKRYRKVFAMCRFAAVMRHGFDRKKILGEVQCLEDSFSARIELIDAPLIEISSTDIRERVKKGRSIKYLVPERVEEYIRENSLYR